MVSFGLELERCLPLLRCELCGNGGKQFIERVRGRQIIICTRCLIHFYDPRDNCHGRKPKYKRRDMKHIRKALYAERGEFCENCYADSDLHLHHVEAVSGGGKDTKDNLVILCADCHKMAHREGLR